MQSSSDYSSSAPPKSASFQPLSYATGVVVWGVGFFLFCLLNPSLKDDSLLASVRRTTAIVVFFSGGQMFTLLPAGLRRTCANLMTQNNNHAEVQDDQDDMILDREVVILVLKWIAVDILLYVGIAALGQANQSLNTTLVFVIYGFGLFYMLPRAARRWCPEHGGSKLVRPLMLAVFIGLPVQMAPQVSVPILHEFMSVDAIVLVYPLALSLIEFLVLSVVYSDKLIEGYTDSSLSVFARALVGVVEGSRIGMLLVVVNTTGTFSGLVYSALSSALIEAMARNDLFYVVPFAVYHFGVGKEIPAEMRMTRMQQLYLGIKPETEYWGLFCILLLRLYDSGEGKAVDDDTCELLPAMKVGWDVLLVLVSGEMLGDFLSVLCARLVRKVEPRLCVRFRYSHPGSSMLLHVFMWQLVGAAFTGAICGMGSLIETLEETSATGGY